MKISVLGLGPSQKLYDPSLYEYSVGVNDIFKFHKVDYLIILDPKRRFTAERLEIIESSTPHKLLSHYTVWNTMPMYQEIELAHSRGDVSELDSKYPYSILSPFVAVVQAYKLGATEIVMYGVDLTHHQKLSDKTLLNVIRKDFEKLRRALNSRGVGLYVCHDQTALKGTIPIRG